MMCHPERSDDGPVIRCVILSEVRPPGRTESKDPYTGRNSPSQHRTFRFYVTDSTDKFKRLATRFLGRQVDNVEHVDLEEGIRD